MIFGEDWDVMSLLREDFVPVLRLSFRIFGCL
jgi:hypothetical protein